MSDFRLDIEELDILPLDGEPESLAVPADEIWYNYYGLQNANILTQFVKVSAPDLELVQRGFPRADGVYQETAYYRVNRIKLSGTIQSTDRAALETLADNLRKYLSEFGGTLRILWGGVARYYDDCYATNLNVLLDERDHYHVDWCPWSVEFVSQHPFARALDRTILNAPYPITVSPTNFAIVNAGNATTDPVMTLNLTTVGSLSEFTIENTTNGDSITISGSFSDGDTIEIDGENKTVKKNGVAIDYSGVIPRAVPGTNILTVTSTGASYSMIFTEQHYSRHL